MWVYFCICAFIRCDSSSILLSSVWNSLWQWYWFNELQILIKNESINVQTPKIHNLMYTSYVRCKIVFMLGRVKLEQLILVWKNLVVTRIYQSFLQRTLYKMQKQSSICICSALRPQLKSQCKSHWYIKLAEFCLGCRTLFEFERNNILIYGPKENPSPFVMMGKITFVSEFTLKT